MTPIVSPAPARAESGPMGLVAAVIAAVGALIRSAPSAGAPDWDPGERARAIAALDRVITQITVYRGGLLGAHKADGRWALAGDRSFEAYRGRTSRTGTGAARGEMELAEALAELPAAAAALHAAEVTLGHARELARLHNRADAPLRRAVVDQADQVLALARDVDAPTFGKRLAAWAAQVDPDGVEASFAAVRARRSLRLSERDGGGHLSGFFDPLAFAAIRTAIHAHAGAPSPGDERTPEQRTADALTTLADAALSAGAVKSGAQIRPHLSLLVPEQVWTLMRREAAADPSRHAARTGADAASGSTAGGGSGAGSGNGTGGATAAGGVGDRAVEGGSVLLDAGPVVLPELDDGTVVPLSELQRLACDCELTRIVLDADGVPLDVGRTQRTYTKELRRAVLARDGHCRWPGCTLRAEWCEVHHVRWYSHGGVTSLANALTLCTFHHHEVHRHDIAITTTAAGTRFTRSHGTPIGTSMPTGARRLLRPSAAVAAPTEVPVDVLPEAGGHRETAPEVPDAALDTVPRADRRSSRPGLAGTAAWAWERAADQPRLIDELPVSEPP